MLGEDVACRNPYSSGTTLEIQLRVCNVHLVFKTVNDCEIASVAVPLARALQWNIDTGEQWLAVEESREDIPGYLLKLVSNS